jgi:hypothetical protein
MAERQRERPAVGGPGGRPGLFDDPTAFEDRTATIAHGPYAENVPIAGMTVSEVRARFADRLDIHPGSRPFVDGSPVTDDQTVVRAGQVLMFARRAGEKGHGRGAR